MEPFRLLRTEPELRRSCLYQASVFAGFSAVWTCLALLLTGPVYRLGAGAVGLLALVGAATVLCTPYAGRLVDRHGPDRVNLVCLLGVLASAAVLLPGARGGPSGLAALALGTLLLDVAMQCGMVASQARRVHRAPGSPEPAQDGLHDLLLPGRQRRLLARGADLGADRLVGRVRAAGRADRTRPRPSPARRPQGRGTGSGQPVTSRRPLISAGLIRTHFGR
ncbi:hypothetical protein ABZW30_15395 [Kitasatospora sp. NPDC004669]|uniref:hypothetical protein n=1 Tax=Kitasatospora sp. NPDC004669 TaxID=3154555 RepID=UPI0033B006CB